MNLILCSTPYHIVNAINLAETIFKEEKNDVIILNHSKSNYGIYLQIKKLNIFNEVSFLKTNNYTGGKSKYKTYRYLKTSLHYINNKKLTSQLKRPKEKYNKILISSPDVPSQIIYYFYKNYNNSIDLCMFEDGTFAYSYFDYKYSAFKKAFINFLFGRDIMEEHKEAYVYKPEFLDTTKNVIINKIPSLDKNDIALKTLLNKVFEYDENYGEKLGSKYIFFDQAFQFESQVEQGKEILKLIVNQVGKDKLTIKIHPRTEKDTYNNLGEVANLPIPFEIMELNNKAAEKVLVSISSTACLNPKIVFNEEPYVIFLHKLIQREKHEVSLNHVFFDIVDKVKNSYSNPQKIFVPNSINELENILKILEGKNITL